MQSTQTHISIAGTIRNAVLFGSPRDVSLSMHADSLFADVRAFLALLQEREVMKEIQQRIARFDHRVNDD